VKDSSLLHLSETYWYLLIAGLLIFAKNGHKAVFEKYWEVILTDGQKEMQLDKLCPTGKKA